MPGNFYQSFPQASQTLAIQTATTTANFSPLSDLLQANPNSAGFTVTLPAANTMSGRLIRVRNNNSSATNFNLVTITDGGSFTTTVATQGEVVEIVSDSTAWSVLDRIIPSVTIPWTPTGSWVANTTYTGLFSRNGDQFAGAVKIATSGVPTTATLTLNLPITIDTAKLVDTSSSMALGIGSQNDSGTRYFGTVTYNNTTSLTANVLDDAAAAVAIGIVTQANPFSWNTGDYGIITFSVPVSGWNG